MSTWVARTFSSSGVPFAPSPVVSRHSCSTVPPLACDCVTAWKVPQARQCSPAPQPFSTARGQAKNSPGRSPMVRRPWRKFSSKGARSVARICRSRFSTSRPASRPPAERSQWGCGSRPHLCLQLRRAGAFVGHRWCYGRVFRLDFAIGVQPRCVLVDGSQVDQSRLARAPPVARNGDAPAFSQTNFSASPEERVRVVPVPRQGPLRCRRSRPRAARGSVPCRAIRG